MPRAVWNDQWRDETAGSLFPFADSATLAGPAVIDRDMFVDALLYPLGGGPGLYLVTAARAGTEATVTIGTEAAPTLCSASWRVDAPPDLLKLQDAYGRPAGVLVCDPVRLGVARGWPAGASKFLPAATQFAAACCVPMPGGGLRGLLVGGELFTGDVWLTGADGVVVSVEDGGIVRVDVAGDPLSSRALCGPRFVTPRLVRTINGLPPDETGNWQIEVNAEAVVNTALRVAVTPPDTLTVSVTGRAAGANR